MMKLSFAKKLWIPLICSLISMSGIFVFDAIQLRSVRIDERRNDLTNIDSVALGVVKYFASQADHGLMSQEQAQTAAKEAIKKLHYGQDGYVAINGFDGVSIMNPASPEHDGQSMVDFKDANGMPIYRAMAEIGQSTQGEGFLSYSWLRPGGTKAVPKLSRVVSFKPWGWALATGVYMDDLDTAFEQSLLRSAGTLLALSGVLALIVSLINRSLSRTIGGAPEYAAKVASQIADNDLTASVATRSDDHASIIYAMKAMQSNLSAKIADIRVGARTIADASREIAVGGNDLSSRTESQASALEETASSMEELTSTVRQNADAAEQANQLASAAYDAAQQGEATVSELVETMNGINTKAEKIRDIIGVIDGIAFQTNILALNAAVEAARAGDRGRGFAVVAAEVRSLSNRSAEAAREVKELILNANTTVQRGVELTDEVGENMRRIMGGSKQVSALITEIAGASREQAGGIQQVSEAVMHMDGVTQQNASLVEESTAAANLLSKQAARLLELVSEFRQVEDLEPGRGAAPAAASQLAESRARASATPANRLKAGSQVKRPIGSTYAAA